MSSKNICFFIVLVFVLLPAAALGQMQFGARLSYDVTFPINANNAYSTGSGFTLGGVANIPLKRSFFIEPGLMFRYASMPSKNLTLFDHELYEGSARVYTIHIPVDLGYTFDINDNMSIAVSTGPYLNVNVAARQKLDPNFGATVHVSNQKISLFNHGWKHVDGGWNIKLGTTFAHSYYVGIGGDISFTPLAKFGDRDKKIRIYRSSVSVILGYNF